jgi:hypothetical protein
MHDASRVNVRDAFTEVFRRCGDDKVLAAVAIEIAAGQDFAEFIV